MKSEAICNIPDSKVHEAYIGSTWGRQDPDGPHVGPMNLAIRDTTALRERSSTTRGLLLYIIIVK